MSTISYLLTAVIALVIIVIVDKIVKKHNHKKLQKKFQDVFPYTYQILPEYGKHELNGYILNYRSDIAQHFQLVWEMIFNKNKLKEYDPLLGGNITLDMKKIIKKYILDETKNKTTEIITIDEGALYGLNFPNYPNSGLPTYYKLYIIDPFVFNTNLILLLFYQNIKIELACSLDRKIISHNEIIFSVNCTKVNSIDEDLSISNNGIYFYQPIINKNGKKERKLYYNEEDCYHTLENWGGIKIEHGPFVKKLHEFIPTACNDL
jgi:hypothetical protein